MHGEEHSGGIFFIQYLYFLYSTYPISQALHASDNENYAMLIQFGRLHVNNVKTVNSINHVISGNPVKCVNHVNSVNHVSSANNSVETMSTV